MPTFWNSGPKPFSKTVISAGYGYHTPQDGSVCKIRVISDESNIITDLDDNKEKEIIVGDVDEPIDRIIEDCIRTMKEEEVCRLRFEHPCHRSESISPKEELTKVPNCTEAEEVNVSDGPQSPKDSEVPEVVKEPDSSVSEEKSEDVPVEDSKNSEGAVNDCGESPAVDGAIKDNETVQGADAENADLAEAVNVETKDDDDKSADDKVTEAAAEDAESESKNDNEDPPSSSNMVEIDFQLMSYTREPEIWEMSVTEKWRRASYHKQKGLDLYSRGAYQHAFRRFGLTLKYVISLEHDIPSGQEESMDIRGLKMSCYLNVAACQMRHYNFESVVANASKALAIKPDSAKALYRRGAALLQLQEYEKAREDLTQAQQLEPKNQAVAKQLQLLKGQVQKLNQYYATAMKKFLS